MRRFPFSMAAIFVLVVSTALGSGGPNLALAEDDGGTAAADSTPVLEALSLLPLEIDYLDFTHWSALLACANAPVIDVARAADAKSDATLFSFFIDSPLVGRRSNSAKTSEPKSEGTGKPRRNGR